MAHRSTVRATVAVAIGLVSLAPVERRLRSESTPYRVVTVRHAPTGFSISAPEGFRLSLRNGVYVLRKGSVTMSFTRLDTRVSPAQFGSTLLRALGGRVLVRAGDARHFVAAVAGGTRNDHFVVERFGSRLAVTTSTTSTRAPGRARDASPGGRSARGGVGLRASAATLGAPIPLRPYRAPDGGATALLPAGLGRREHDGTIQGSSARGAFLFGFSFNIPLDGPPSSATVLHHRAVPQCCPRRSCRSSRGSPVREGHPDPPRAQDAILPSFTSSGMILFDYRLNGRPLDRRRHRRDRPPVEIQQLPLELLLQRDRRPAGSSPAVGVALLRCVAKLEPEWRDRREDASGRQR